MSWPEWSSEGPRGGRPIRSNEERVAAVLAEHDIDFPASQTPDGYTLTCTCGWVQRDGETWIGHLSAALDGGAA